MKKSIRIRKNGGYCFLCVGFIYVYFTIAMFGTLPNEALAQALGKAFLIGSITFLSIGVLVLVLDRRRAEVRSVRAKGYEYLEAFPYFCENCKRFTFRILEYCEECGMKGCVRGASYGDYEKYVSGRSRIISGKGSRSNLDFTSFYMGTIGRNARK